MFNFDMIYCEEKFAVSIRLRFLTRHNFTTSYCRLTYFKKFKKFCKTLIACIANQLPVRNPLITDCHTFVGAF